MTGISGHRENEEVTALFERAATDPDLVLLEGFHAVKHAFRFGAEVLGVIATDAERVTELARELAPDLLPTLLPCLSLGHPPRGESHWTGVWAVARKNRVDLTGVLGTTGSTPVILLEDPRHMGNLGASIRVAAGAGAAALVVLGSADVWAPAAVRGAAGLQYALPVGNLTSLGETPRPIVALDPLGEELRAGVIPPGALLAFGTERDGLSESLLSRASMRLRIPMRPGVSSLNLAVSVGIALYLGGAAGHSPHLGA